MAKKTTGSAADIDQLKQTLQALLETKESQDRILELLHPLTEDQRRELAPMCLKHYRKVKKDQFIEDPPNTFQMNPLLFPAEVALFSVASFTEIKKAGRRALPDGEIIIEVLKQRRPKWADGIAEMLLHSSYYWNSWSTVREMVRQKLCDKPDDPRYCTGMIAGLCRRSFDRENMTALDGPGCRGHTETGFRCEDCERQ